MRGPLSNNDLKATPITKEDIRYITQLAPTHDPIQYPKLYTGYPGLLDVNHSLDHLYLAPRSAPTTPSTSSNTPTSSRSAHLWGFFKRRRKYSTLDEDKAPLDRPTAVKRSPARLKKPAKFKSTSDLKSHSTPPEVDFAPVFKPIPSPEYSARHVEAAMSGTTDNDPPRYFTMNPDWDSSQDDSTLFLLLLATGQGSHTQQTETKPHAKWQRKRTFFFPQPSSRSIESSFLDL